MSLYITNVFNLKILEDLGQGIHIRGGIYLTNNLIFIRSFLSENTQLAIGNLEFEVLYNANVIFYKISEDEISNTNDDDLLCNFLANCKNIINELWLIKDHSIDIMLGFVEYPYIKSSFIDLPYNSSLFHSNWVTGGSNTSTGEYYCTNFNRNEIEQVISWGSTILIEPFSESQNRKSAMSPGVDRISLCNVFLQTARKEFDIGIKITHYCSAFECLFSTDTTELTHKLSERVAYFLETEPQHRIALYNDLKNIYSIRSQVTHGSVISKKLFPKITEYSKKADDILRRVSIKLRENESLDKYFRGDNNEELEKYLTALTLGLDS